MPAYPPPIPFYEKKSCAKETEYLFIFFIKANGEEQRWKGGSRFLWIDMTLLRYC